MPSRPARPAVRAIALATALLLLPGSAGAGEARAQPDLPRPGLTATLGETKLLFGLSSADGSGVSEQEWAQFLSGEITPRFPDGLTVIATYGQVKGEAHGAQQVVREDMRLVLIYHQDTPEAAARLAEIRRLHAERYHQWGVLQVTSAVRVTL